MSKERKMPKAGRATGATPAVKANDTEALKLSSERVETNVYMEEIHARADAMTPLLKEFLEFHPPPHWTLNN